MVIATAAPMPMRTAGSSGSGRPSNQPSRKWPSAPSATQPRPNEASVIPNWPAERTRVRLRREVAVSAKRANWSPPRTMASRRDRRARTRANSTATKKALRASRATMASKRDITERYDDCQISRQPEPRLGAPSRTAIRTTTPKGRGTTTRGTTPTAGTTRTSTPSPRGGWHGPAASRRPSWWPRWWAAGSRTRWPCWPMPAICSPASARWPSRCSWLLVQPAAGHAEAHLWLPPLGDPRGADQRRGAVGALLRNPLGGLPPVGQPGAGGEWSDAGHRRRRPARQCAQRLAAARQRRRQPQPPRCLSARPVGPVGVRGRDKSPRWPCAGSAGCRRIPWPQSS